MGRDGAGASACKDVGRLVPREQGCGLPNQPAADVAPQVPDLLSRRLLNPQRRPLRSYTSDTVWITYHNGGYVTRKFRHGDGFAPATRAYDCITKVLEMSTLQQGIYCCIISPCPPLLPEQYRRSSCCQHCAFSLPPRRLDLPRSSSVYRTFQDLRRILALTGMTTDISAHWIGYSPCPLFTSWVPEEGLIEESLLTFGWSPAFASNLWTVCLILSMLAGGIS